MTSNMVPVVKNNAGDIRDVGLIPGSRRFPGRGYGNPLQYAWRTFTVIINFKYFFALGISNFF